MTNEEKIKEMFPLYEDMEDYEVVQTVFKRRGAIEMGKWKDKKIKEMLLAYTKWLDKRGFFKEDLQCDFLHQIETFLEMKGEEK